MSFRRLVSVAALAAATIALPWSSALAADGDIKRLAPADAYMAVYARNNPERAYQKEYVEEAWQTFQDERIAERIFDVISRRAPEEELAKFKDAWAEIGAINADDAPAIQVMPGEEGKFAPLRGGCLGQEPCSEFTHYEWNGQKYVRTWIDFKGYAVDVAPGGLRTITQDAAVLDAPNAKKGQVLDEYPIGTAMIVIGGARDAPYSFVSPCSSCRRGFIETALLAPAR